MAERTVLRGNQTQQGYLRLMTERYTIFSETGDEYRLQFTTDRSNIIADRILDLLLQDGIEKAQRLQKIQERWENGEYKNVEVVQL